MMVQGEVLIEQRRWRWIPPATFLWLGLQIEVALQTMSLLRTPVVASPCGQICMAQPRTAATLLTLLPLILLAMSMSPAGATSPAKLPPLLQVSIPKLAFIL